MFSIFSDAFIPHPKTPGTRASPISRRRSVELAPTSRQTSRGRKCSTLKKDSSKQWFCSFLKWDKKGEKFLLLKSLQNFVLFCLKRRAFSSTLISTFSSHLHCGRALVFFWNRHADKGYKMSAAVPFLPMSPALEGIPGNPLAVLSNDQFTLVGWVI